MSGFLSSLGNIFSGLAPTVGTLLGGAFGGPGGAMLGNTLGNVGGNLIGGLTGGNKGQSQSQSSNSGFGQQSKPRMSSQSSSDWKNNWGPGFAGAPSMFQPGGMWGPQLSGRSQGGMGQMPSFGSHPGSQSGFGGFNPQQTFGQAAQGAVGNFADRFLPESMKQAGFGNAFSSLAGGLMNQHMPQLANQQMYQPGMGMGMGMGGGMGMNPGQMAMNMSNQFLPQSMQDAGFGSAFSNLANQQFGGMNKNQFGNNQFGGNSQGGFGNTQSFGGFGNNSGGGFGGFGNQQVGNNQPQNQQVFQFQPPQRPMMTF